MGGSEDRVERSTRSRENWVGESGGRVKNQNAAGESGAECKAFLPEAERKEQTTDSSWPAASCLHLTPDP